MSKPTIMLFVGDRVQIPPGCRIEHRPDGEGLVVIHPDGDEQGLVLCWAEDQGRAVRVFGNLLEPEAPDVNAAPDV